MEQMDNYSVGEIAELIGDLWRLEQKFATTDHEIVVDKLECHDIGAVFFRCRDIIENLEFKV